MVKSEMLLETGWNTEKRMKILRTEEALSGLEI